MSQPFDKQLSNTLASVLKTRLRRAKPCLVEPASLSALADDLVESDGAGHARVE
jgi:hypothetical protein